MPPQPQQTREEFVKSLFLLEKGDNLFTGKVGRNKLIDGINKTVDAVKDSYGASGSNVIIQDDLYPFHRVINDGKTIVQSVKLSDSIENMGANIVREVADKSDKESGDGRKTTMILLQAIIQEGLKHKDIDVMDLKRSLDECLPIILKNIDEQTKDIDVDQVKEIATIASESEKLGELFGEIYSKIGKDGIVELDNSGFSESFYETTNGVRLLNCGMQYEYMVTDNKGRKAVCEFPYVLITKQRLSNIKELDYVLQEVKKKGESELVIFCDEIDLPVSQALAFLHTGTSPQGQQIQPFKTLVIKAPTLWKDWLFEDFAKITGATVIDPTQGKTLRNFQFSYLGYCDKIITSKTETIVLGTKNIDNHIQVLSELNTDESKIRISRLNTKTAILKLGANSESELSYIKAKALDGRNSSFLALNYGVVLGAGQALHMATSTLPNTIGGQIMQKALAYPNALIAKNMSLTKVTPKTFKNIYDSALVVKNAITNAVSVASMVLTTNVVITK